MEIVCFDDLEVSQKYRTDLSHPLNQERIQEYIHASGDAYPIHSDRDFALSHGFDELVVPGHLVLSTADGLLYTCGFLRDSIVIMKEEDNTKYRRLVYVNESICCEVEITELDERRKKPHGRIKLKKKIFNEKDLLVVESDVEYYVKK